MRKKEKKSLLNEYKSLLIFMTDLKDFSEKDQEYYKGIKEGLERTLRLLNINYKELEKQISKDYSNLDQELEELKKRMI